MLRRGVVVLVAGLVVQLALGALYAWSTLAAALQQQYHVEPSKASSVVGVAILTFTVVMIFGGQGVARFGPRVMTVISAALFASGYLLSSLANGHYVVLLLGAGVLVGAGIGCGYTAPISACLAWFPQRKGLITGLAVAGFGGGALLLSQWAEWLLNRGWDVHHVLRMIAAINGTGVLLGGLFLVTPKQAKDEVAEGMRPERISTKHFFRRREFWASVVGMFSATFGGLLVIGNLKSIGLSYGIPAGIAATAVGFFAIGNSAGRLLWGGVYDKWGRWTLVLALVIQGIFLMAMGHAQEAVLFTPIAVACGFLFGAAFVLYAADLATQFGNRAFPIVYPWVFLAYGVAGLTGPYIGGKIYELSGSYVYACYVAAAVSVVGAIGYVILRQDMVHTLLARAEQVETD